MRREGLPLPSQQPGPSPFSPRYGLLLLPVPPLASAVVPVSEAQLQQMVIDLAHWAGFMHWHVTDPRRSRPGFPDLVLVHTTTGRLVFVELKSEKGRIRPEQDVWLTHLGKLHEAYVWRPVHWETGLIRKVLTEGRAVAA